MSTRPSSGRLAYDDLATPAQMSRDARAVRAAMRAASSDPTEPFALGCFTQAAAKRGEIEVPEAAARLAAALHLQLDGD
jgi:hypothetical protein